MLRRFGWFYQVLGLGRMLGRLRIDDASVDRVRQASDKGPIVYVLAEASAMDHLALNTVLNRRRLPLSEWSNGTNSFWWQPVADAWRDLAKRVHSFLSDPADDPVQSGWLANTVAAGHAVTLFLNTSGTFRWAPQKTPLQALIDAQRQSDRPVQLLPVVVMWNKAPEIRRTQVQDFILGNRDAPGAVGQLRNAYFRSSNAFVQVGDPVDVGEFLERTEHIDQPRALHTLLRRYLRRESQVIRGPRLLPYATMKRVVLENPPMRELAMTEAKALGVSEAEVLKKMSRHYDVIAANFRWWIIQLLSVVLQPLWTRVFSGVDVRDEDIERIREAMRNGSAVLIPCHKSHFDYVLLSWVFWKYDLIVPHVVAGANLNIWPISIFLRGAGGFFVKRSFAGDRLFPAVFSRYLRELLRQGYPVEFFIEGGRTRSGKLMPPRVGVLGMVLEAAELRKSGTDITLLPMSLSYEQVAEERAYARELGGEDKEAESVGQLVKATSVLRRRFGRVYLRVGSPIPCGELVDQTDEQPSWSQRTRADRKERLHQVGERVIHRIGAVTVVLPTSLVAMALLAHHRRGITQEALKDRIHRLHGALLRAGALESASLRNFDQAITSALDRFHRGGRIEALEHDGQRVWAIVPDQRITLAFYKNQVLHYLAPAGLAACALRALDDSPQHPRAILPGFSYLVWLLRAEFRLDPDKPVSALLEEGLDALAAMGALERVDEAYRVHDPSRIGEVYTLFRDLLEAYEVTLLSLSGLATQHKTRKSLAKALQRDASSMLANAAVSRPESLSLVPLENALRTLKEDGVLREDGDHPLQADLSRRDTLLERLQPMVH